MCIKSILQLVPIHEYNNEESFCDRLATFSPWVEKENKIANLVYAKAIQPKDKRSLLYLKNSLDADLSGKSLDTIELIIKSPPYIVDDPSENPTPSMTWYIDNITKSFGIFVELLSLEDRASKLHNAKCFFVVGMALAFDRRPLMISEKSNPSCLKSTFLNVLNESNEFDNIVKPYLESIRDYLPEFIVDGLNEEHRREETSRNGISERQRQNPLSNIRFGSFLAEHEEINDLSLEGYYSNIWNIEDMISSPSNLFVGRKGVGKTATLKALENFLSRKENTHVCVLEPLNEEMEGLELPLELLSKSQSKHIIKSVWKSLIYTQIIISINSNLQKKDLSAYSQSELELSDFVRNNRDIFYESLAERLRSIKNRLGIFNNNLNRESDTHLEDKKFYDSISESLHFHLIKNVNDQLVHFLDQQRMSRIVVLIDNLDKAWEQNNSSYEIQSLWIRELIDVSNVIIRDLSKVNQKTGKDISFNLFMFLRSDIFYHVKASSSEPDKIKFTKLSWEPRDKLFSAIDKRIDYLNLDLGISSNDFWEKYVTRKVNGIPTKDFIYERIIPRPRDLIYFLTEARDQAKYRNEDNSQISEQDVIESYKDYSTWIFQFLKAESIAQLDRLQADSDSLMEFLILLGTKSKNSIISKDEVSKCAIEAFTTIGGSDFDNLIDHLVSVSVLGLETSSENFEYVYDFDQKQRIKLLSEQMGSPRYKIHNSLVPFIKLELEEEKQTKGLSGLYNMNLKRKVSFYLFFGQATSFLVTTFFVIIILIVTYYQNKNLKDIFINIFPGSQQEQPVNKDKQPVNKDN